MEKEIQAIKTWLGTGSINIFGIQFSGKDTVGQRLSEALNAQFIISGDIVRANAQRLSNETNSDQGLLAPTKEYVEVIKEYLARDISPDQALVLSSLGRWIGEEQPIISALKKSGHATKAVLHLKISEDEVWRRWEIARDSRNGGRVDDINQEKVARRIREFKDKTLPVIAKYRAMGLLIEIDGEQSRDEVFAEVCNKLVRFA
jgi:adenylate kinase